MEAQRQLLEELDVLEWAIAQRFKRNPELIAALGLQEFDPIFDSVPKRPHKETLIQQHEIKFFVEQHAANRARVKSGFESGAIQAEAQRLKDPKKSYDALLQAVAELQADERGNQGLRAVSLKSQYALYLCAPPEEAMHRKKKRKYFLAAALAHLYDEVDRMFSASEMYGKYVDLFAFHVMYQALGARTVSYVDYLKTFREFQGASSKSDYIKYLKSLLAYLERFYHVSHPFRKIEYPEAPVEKTTKEDGATNSNGEVYCKVCEKNFAKKAVYEGHLQGKKHKKKAAANGTTKVSSQPPQAVLQHRIRHICSLLEEIIESTINDHHRRAGLSERERKLEVVAVQGEDSECTAVDSDSEKENLSDPDDGDLFGKDLPLGSDGIPIPLWLYKLQGLHRSYNCEICSNVAYKGRLQFNRHFSLVKHVYGLTCLGVNEEDVPLFANITSIAEAEELLKKIRRSKRKMEEITENAVEIEDEEGNIMSQKDYMELKKQGLI